MSRCIAVVSGKGGVGKTTTAINIATSMSKHGKNTVLLDSNLSTPNVGLHLGIPNPTMTLNQAMNQDINISQAIHKHKSGLKLIPASLSMEELKVIDMENFKNILPDLNNHADIVVMDTAAGLNREALAVLESCDEVLLVTTPDLVSVTDTLRSVKVAEFLGKAVLGIVISMSKNDKFEMQPRAIEEMVGYPVISTVPYHKHIKEAFSKRQPVVHSHPNSKVTKEYERLVSYLLGERYFQTSKHNTFLDYVLRRLGLL
ncbi:MAG: cell division ATPase MinD [archaeon]